MELENEPLISPESSSEAGDKTQWGARFWFLRALYPLVLLCGCVFPIIELTTDRYFSVDLSKLKDRDLMSVPKSKSSAIVKSTGLGVVDPSNKYHNLGYSGAVLKFDHTFFNKFADDIVSLDYILSAWTAARIIGYISLICASTALITYAVFRRDPSTMVFQPSSTLANSWKRALPVWLSLASGIMGMIRLLLVTSLAEPISFRYWFTILRLEVPADVWTNIVAGLDSQQPRIFLLDTFRAVGHWFLTGGCTWNISTYLILGSLVVGQGVFVGAFFFDAQSAREKMGIDSDEARMRIRRDLSRLSRMARVPHIIWSLSLFGLAIAVTKFTGRYVNNRGRWLNRLPWTSHTPLPEDTLMDDLISSKTISFWFQPPKVIDGAVLIWLPILFSLIISSLERLAFLSKMIEIVAYGYLLRSVSIAFTIVPSAMTLLQRPICYDDSQMSFSDSLKTNNFCNDMIFSGHSVLAVVPAITLILLLVYGPFKNRVGTIVTISIGLAISLSVILLGRFHYTADVVIAFVVCFLLVLIHSPALKIFFSYRRFEIGHGKSAQVEKVAGELESASTTIETAIKSAKIDNGLTSWTLIEEKKETIRNLLQKLQDTTH